MTQCSHQELLHSEISNMLTTDYSIWSQFMETTKQIDLVCHQIHYKELWEEQVGEGRVQEASVGCEAVLTHIVDVLQELQSETAISKVH